LPKETILTFLQEGAAGETAANRAQNTPA
jgi:hypothetical protein